MKKKQKSNIDGSRLTEADSRKAARATGCAEQEKNEGNQ